MSGTYLQQGTHGYSILKEIPDNYVPEFAGKFDLVNCPGYHRTCYRYIKGIDQCPSVPCSRWIISFYYPEWHEDVLEDYLTYIFNKSPSELLINHVNYFDGKGLKEILMRKGFKSCWLFYLPVLKPPYAEPDGKRSEIDESVSVKKPLIYRWKSAEISTFDLDKTKILDKWYIREQSNMDHLSLQSLSASCIDHDGSGIKHRSWIMECLRSIKTFDKSGRNTPDSGKPSAHFSPAHLLAGLVIPVFMVLMVVMKKLESTHHLWLVIPFTHP